MIRMGSLFVCRQSHQAPTIIVILINLLFSKKKGCFVSLPAFICFYWHWQHTFGFNHKQSGYKNPDCQLVRQKHKKWLQRKFFSNRGRGWIFLNCGEKANLRLTFLLPKSQKSGELDLKRSSSPENRMNWIKMGQIMKVCQQSERLPTVRMGSLFSIRTFW